MSNYYEAKRDGVVERTLKKRGQAMILRRTASGVYDPTQGKAGAGSTKDYGCFGLIQNIDSSAAKQFYGSGVVEGLIQKEDEMVILSAKGLATDSVIPTNPTDILIMANGERYNVIHCIKIAPAGIPIMFKVHVRK